MAIEYKFLGETFLMDDSEGCYIKVTYDKVPDHTGYAAPALDPSTTYPYTATTFDNATGDIARYVTPAGLQQRGYDDTQESAVQRVCDLFIQIRREEVAHKNFNPEKAYRDLHEWMRDMERKQNDT